jgi:hypothetical protein
MVAAIIWKGNIGKAFSNAIWSPLFYFSKAFKITSPIDCVAASLLTPNALRCSTLSSLREKRVKKAQKTFQPSFRLTGVRVI